MSSQYCGCDPEWTATIGATVLKGHLCERHMKEARGMMGQVKADVAERIVGAVKPGTYYPGDGRSVTGGAIAWTAPIGIKDSGERVTYASGSMRDPSTGKIKWSRITFGPMMRRWAQHLTNAEVKYPDPMPGIPNFTLVETEEEYRRYKESAFRHFMSWFHEETDEDHASAVFFNINGVEIIKDKREGR